MASKVRHPSLYWKGRRFAAQYQGTFTPTMASEPIYNEDGYVDMSEGPKESDVECTFMQLVAGTPIVFHVGDRGSVTLSPVNGQVVQIENAIVMEAPADWDATKGTMTGKLKFHGGEPKYTG